MVLLLAFSTMLIDHIGMIFFPTEDYWRMIGRIAFPLFAWGIVRGYKMTKNKLRYARRIFILAIISQLPSFFVSGYDLVNVCFTLLFWLISLEIIDHKKINIILKIIFVSCLLFIADFFQFDYGVYGILTMILLFFTWQKKMSVVYFFLLTFLFYCIDFQNISIHFHIQLLAVLSIFILYFTPIQKYDFPINFYFKYGFYPVHLMVLYLIFLIFV